MNFFWYLHRLKKMGPAEIVKRLGEYAYIGYSRVEYRNPSNWPYRRFAPKGVSLVRHRLPAVAMAQDWKHYPIYGLRFNLTQPLDWHFSNQPSRRWPTRHFSRINYRPDNPYGDVRINWELNRLQFLPAMAVTDEALAKNLLENWLRRNPYLHGPAYLAAMEVALRWFSIYWALCRFRNPIDPSLERNVTGLAVASGRYIARRLSTHSSAGNHLIVEAVGLFWLGKALERHHIGRRWTSMARAILHEQIPIQIHADGSNQEQSFWYLGFVLDAVFHYLLLEDNRQIPKQTGERIQSILQYVHEMILPDGSFPDYGDRDDGFVFRLAESYDESPFPGLLTVGASFFNRPEWLRATPLSIKRCAFWKGREKIPSQPLSSRTPQRPHLKSFHEAGSTVMEWHPGRLLLRHSHLGLGETCGHGHADALSVLFFWLNVPVLIDLGSGQYNGDQAIRNFFRSTIAHNTIEIGGRDQATMLGPFMWEKSYHANLTNSGESPVLFAEAIHDGYMDDFSVMHTRKVKWLAPHRLDIHDSLSGSGGWPMRGAFHLGDCQAVVQEKNVIEADFGDFKFSISFPSNFSLHVFYGSNHPFMGWRSTIYGAWKPSYSIIFSSQLQSNHQHRITLSIAET